MPITEAERRAHRNYMKKAYAKLHVNYPKTYVEMVKAKAEEAGESIAGYVKKAIDERIQREEKPD